MSLKRKVGLGVAAVVAMALIGSGVVAWKASSSLLYPDDEAPPVRPDGLTIEDVSFTSSDGVNLSGWYIRPPSCVVDDQCSDAPAVVLSHGRGSNRGAFENELPLLHRNGYAVLTFDYRGMGESQDVATTAGANEPLDLDAAVEFVQTQPGVRSGPVAVIGKSLGATIALRSAAGNDDIAAVVSEAGFARLSEVVTYNFELETGIPPFPLAPISIWVAEQRAEVDLEDVDAVDAVARINGSKPILFAHARGDERVRYDQSIKMFDAAGEPKELWTLEGDIHANSIEADPLGWNERVLPFLSAALD